MVEEQDNPWDSLDECYMISSAFPGLSDPHGNSRRADIHSFQNLDICSPLEATRESSTVHVIKLQLASQVAPLFLVSNLWFR